MKQRYVLLALLHVVAFSFLSLSANPTGGDVVGGSATIQTAPTTVTIQQQSQAAVINWQSFSIDSGELTKFIQPNSSAAVLNRVLGGSTSYLNGTLSANGQVYLINGNGIVIGQGGLVNTAGFIASTRDISNSDFLSGNLHFTGSSNAGVQNLGTVKALGGDVYFIGQTVDNEGTIHADGNVGLAAGNDVLITQSGSEHVFIQPLANSGASGSLTGVTNAGSIAASTAELKAANGNIYALAINNTGSIRATGVQHQGGHIYLTSDTGTIQNSGTLNASATAAGGTGGTIKLKTGGALITTSTSQILAHGGTGGRGGQIETSGETAQLDGVIYAGAGGSWLIDPQDVDITATLAGIINADLASNSSVTIDTTGTTATGTPTDVNGGLGATTGSGNITVDSALTFASTTTAGTSLTLNAAGAIVVNQSITTATGGSGSVALSGTGITLDAPITLNTTSGVLTLTLTGSGSAIQGTTGAITANGLLLEGSAGASQYLLTNTGNSISTLAANAGSTSGGISYTNNGSFTVGTVGGTSGISAPTANVTLKTATGTLTVSDTITTGSGTATLDAPTIDLNTYVAGNVAGTANVATVNLGPAIGTSENLVDDTYITEGVTLLASSTATTPTLNLNSTSTYYLGSPVNIGSSLTLNGNGATLDGGSTSSLLSITSGTVTISDLTFQNGKSSGGGGAVYIGTAPTVTINNSTFTDNQASGESGLGGAIYNSSGLGSLTLGNDSFSNNTSSDGLSNDIYNAGTVTINGGTSNTVTVNPGGIETGGSVTLDATTINLNGPVTIVNDSNGSVAGTANVATVNVGTAEGTSLNPVDDAFIQQAIDLLSNSTATTPTVNLTSSSTYYLGNPVNIASDLTLEGNGATLDGGSGTALVNVTDGTVVLDDMTLQNASNTDFGGSALNVTGGTVTLQYSTVQDNSSNGQGGAIYNDATLTLSSDSITGNTATGTGSQGGGIYNDSDGTLTVTAGSITSNSADQGGGIYNAGTLTTTDNQIKDNTVTLSGGGIYNTGSMTLNDPTIKGNSGATDNSNGIYSETATGTFQINGDSGVDSGYAITLDDDILIKAGALTIDTDSADSTHGTASVTLNGLIDSVGTVTIYGDTITANKSVTGSSLTLASDAAGTVTLNNSAAFTATDTTGNSIQITTGTFTNNSTSSTPLSVSGTANWDIYNLNTETDPSAATLGNLAPDYVQVAYTDTLSGTGNGLIYAFTPSAATVALGGTTTKTYDGTTNVTDVSGLTLTGTGPYSGDSLTVSDPSSLPLTNYSYTRTDVVDNNSETPGNVSVSGVTFSATSTLGGQLSTAVPIYGYTLAASTITGAVGIINPETITGSIPTQTLTYGTEPDLTSASISISTGTLYGSDSLSLTTTDGLSTGGYYNATEGSNLTAALNSTNPNASGNYVLSIPDGTLVINQKVIDPTIVGPVTKTYDASSAAALTSDNYGLVGAVSGDDVSLVGPTGTYAGTYSTTTSASTSVSGANADTTGALLPAASHYYVVANTGETPLSLSGEDAGNYVLSSTANVSAQVGIIKQHAVPVTINGQSITYGQDGNINLVYTEGVTGSTTATSLPDEGLTASDLIQSLAVFQTNTSTLATQNTFSHYNAGSYDLGVISKGNSNYALQVTPGTLSVSQAVLTYVPAPAGGRANTSVYGFTPVTPSGTVTGFATGESAENFSGSGTAVFTTDPTLAYNSGVGSYPITGSGLSSSNYTFSQAGGNYVVTQAPLTVSLDPSLIQVNQGQSVPFLNVVYNGFISGDNFNVVFGEQTLNISTPATGSSLPGNYPINLSGLTAVNYAITYLDGTLQVLGSNQAVNQTSSAGSDQSLINNNTSVNTILVLAPGSGNDGSTFGMSEDNGQGYGHGSTFSRAEGQIVTTSSGIAVIYGDVHFGHLSQDLSQQVQNYLNGDTQAALSQWLTLGE